MAARISLIIVLHFAAAMMLGSGARRKFGTLIVQPADGPWGPTDAWKNAMWEEQAHRLRTEINIVAVVLWLGCFWATVGPLGSRPITRIIGGVLLALLTFVYLFSYGPVRHAVLSNPLVKTVTMPCFKGHDRWIMHQIKDYLPPPGSRVLNFGAGGNTLSDELVSYGYDVVPLDIVDESIAETPVVVYDGQEIPPELGKFDAAVVATVLHHIEDKFIPHILDQLALRARRIVILEDVATKESFVDTAMHCVKMNLELFNHPLNFRSHEAWEARLQKYNLVNSTTSEGFSVFVLQPGLAL